MTYGRRHLACAKGGVSKAAASHSAELVRGKCFASDREAPSSALRAPSPQGEKGSADARHKMARPHPLAAQIDLHHALVRADLVDGAFCQHRAFVQHSHLDAQ